MNAYYGLTMLKWTETGDRRILETPVFNVHERKMRSPDETFEADFYLLDLPDWVNVVALTPEGDLILVNQYRFGAAKMSLEVPGGVVDAGESLLEAARRELLEETGHISDEWSQLAVLTPNPALNTNRCGIFLAQHCRTVAEQHLDETEFLEVEYLNPSSFNAKMKNGIIHHSLTVASIGLFMMEPSFHQKK